MSTLFPKEKERIIEFLLDNPNKYIKVRDLARQLNLSPAHISRTLKILNKNNMFKNNRIDISNSYVRALKIFFNVKKLVEKNVTKILNRLNASGIGIYGSWANGTNTEDSDVDIWVKVEKHLSEIKVATISADIAKILGRSVQILVLSPNRIERLKKEDPIFYYSLVFGSLTLIGETLE